MLDGSLLFELSSPALLLIHVVFWGSCVLTGTVNCPK